MQVIASTTTDLKTLFIGKVAEYLNFVKTLITVQDGRIELTTLDATILFSAKDDLILIIVITGGNVFVLQLNAEAPFAADCVIGG
jgi:hypothetical protein